MSYSDVTIKRLFTRSQNQCAMPKCTSPILIGSTVVGEICHIRARRKNGPRFDPLLTSAQRDEYPNLILLCATCHKRVDSEPHTFTVDLLAEIKEFHEAKGDLEVTPEIKRQSAILFQHLAPKRKVTAKTSGSGVAVAVGGDNHGKIIINQAAPKKAPKSKYPANSIGADANLSGYIEYLMELAYKYWESVAAMTPGRIGRKIKTEFRLGKRTRLHLGVQRFQDLVDFIINKVLAPSPVGKRHGREGTKLCRTFEEWRNGPM
jgi:hypothetical protein